MTTDQTDDYAPAMLALAKQMHEMAGALWNTDVPADIMHRLTSLADDMQQIASEGDVDEQSICQRGECKMSFMQQQIYFGDYFEVETYEGLEIVPCDVVGLTINVHVEALLNYLESTPLDPDEMCEVKSGWLASMSSEPARRKTTFWSAYETEKEARDALTEMYGDDAEGDSE